MLNLALKKRQAQNTIQKSDGKSDGKKAFGNAILQ